MKYIFISHVSEDKPRLEPYLRYLLEKLPQSVGLWIDTPHRIDPQLALNPRISGIQAGENWLRQLLDAVASDKCIVFGFWSTNATSRNREVFEREIDCGRQLRKCVQVCLDTIDLVRIPTPYNFDHVLDVSGFSSADDDGAFDIAVNKLLELLSIPDVRRIIVPVEKSLARDFLRETIIGTEDEKQFLKAWETISNIFFSNASIMKLLNENAFGQLPITVDVNDRAASEYIRFRLLCKKGKLVDARRAYAGLVDLLDDCSEGVRERLFLMTTARALADDVVRVEEIKSGGSLPLYLQKLEDSKHIGETTKIYESTSIRSDLLMGKLRTKTAAADKEGEFAWDLSQYSLIVDYAKGLLHRHDVVLISIRLYWEIWKCLELRHDFERADELIQMGYQRSRIRRNNIFFIQMLVSEAIALWARGEEDESMVKLLVASELIRRQELGRDHEGIAQLVGILKTYMPQCWHIMDCLWGRGLLQKGFVDGVLRGSYMRPGMAQKIASISTEVCAIHGDIPNYYWNVAGKIV